MPKSLNSLMKHLRESGIAICGSTQKRRLKNIGYYHGYKGYRFAGKASNKLPLTNFSQIAALYDFDTQLKSLLYPRVMQIETALKNYTLEAVLYDSCSESFEDIWRKSLTDYRSHKGAAYSRAWEKRLRLRGEIDGLIFRNHKNRDVIGHFRDADKDIPIWAIFEVMTLGNFGSFYDCLNKRVKTSIVNDLGMPTNLESERRLRDIIYALKDLRNAVAHNGVILDVRFRTSSINTGVAQLLKQELGVAGIDFADITDYIVLITYLMRQIRLTKTECKQFISGYETILESIHAELPFNIYSKIIKTDARRKLRAARYFLSRDR
ncbi:MAG TPA: Abi family protein [Collinsella ihuae]|uniref:Abi family protein n=1 Tax=Collinsella ihumii TaxID=1720204 RepID=A0A921IRE2_9ACTN|nr:Abi family protein [Collinsella ihumii]